MCGIFSYYGDKQAYPILLEGLRLLEYRGYDSAGVAIGNGDSKLRLIKTKGTTEELENRGKGEDVEGNMGIAHTRWATHGRVTDENAHPHTGNHDKIAIVHNGIIENANDIREELIQKGSAFTSETDSEVIAHLLESFQGPLEQSMIKTMRALEGTFAIAALDIEQKKIVAARRGSPLILGAGDNEFFVSSDTSPFLKYTNKVIFLEENTIVSIDDKGIKIMNLEGRELDANYKVLDEEYEDLDLGLYQTYMRKEIHEQPDVMRNNIPLLKDDSIDMDLELDPVFLKELRRIVITACGTSWHAAHIGKHIIEKSLGIPVEVDYASEFRYRDAIISEKDLFIGISQSGETADTLAALGEAKKKGALTIGIINAPGSTMDREVDKTIYINAGKEIGVASTKAFTAQILALNILNLYLDQYLERMSPDERRSIIKEMRELPIKLEAALSQEEHIKRIAMQYDNKGMLSNALFMGRGINFPTALEGALKLKEISYVHAEGYPAAEMKHGPIALIDENMPSLFIANNGNQLYQKVLSNMEEVNARGGRIIAITDHNDAHLKKLCDHVINVPKTHPFLSPIINTIPLQLFAYYVASLRGLDVDKPRNLAKSVTVE